MKYDNMPSLCEAHAKYFKVGTCLNSRDFVSHDSILKKHFNCITDEGMMKWEPTEPEDGVFTWEEADKIANYAKDNGMALRAHAPLWHIQTARWTHLDRDGKPASRELLIERIERHTKAFCERYGGQFFCWDVVNEVIDDGPDGGLLRKTKWLEGIGDDYIDIAYKLARKYAPDAQLFYNDYNEYDPIKRDKIVRLMRGMQERGIPLDGFGMQSHINVHEFDIGEYKRTIETYAALGLRIHITELDVSPYSSRERMLPAYPYTDELVARQAEIYRQVFAAAREYSDVIDDVTTWGVADDINWLDGWLRPGRNHYPLLFYYDHTPKFFTRQIVEDAICGR